MKNKCRVRIKKYDFSEGKEKTITKNITKEEFREIKDWQKSHPEFSDAYSIKKVNKC